MSLVNTNGLTHTTHTHPNSSLHSESEFFYKKNKRETRDAIFMWYLMRHKKSI